jgi:hypothetical protein
MILRHGWRSLKAGGAGPALWMAETKRFNRRTGLNSARPDRALGDDAGRDRRLWLGASTFQCRRMGAQQCKKPLAASVAH